MAYSVKKHDTVIRDAMRAAQQGVNDNLKALENRVAEIVGSGLEPTQLRGEITTAYQQYAQLVGSSVAPIVAVAEDTDSQLETEITAQDDTAKTALVAQAQNTVGEVVNTGIEDVMTTIVMASAAGATTSALVDSARGRVSGVFMESNDTIVRRTQRKLQKLLDNDTATNEEVRGAVKQIRERLQGINTTSSLRDLTAKSVQDTVMKFDGAYTAGKAKRAGAQRWRYDGGVINETRDWCREHVGETYTTEEIERLWTSSWGGKEEGDPFVVRGGYNCRHFWVPVDNA